MKNNLHNTITCPNCKHSIKLNKNVLNFISDKFREAERDKIKEEFQFEILEKNLLINQIREQLSNIQKKAVKQSQQHTGEVGEIIVEDVLRDTFRNDDVIPIGKGVKGGDVFLIIKDNNGSELGKILYESKRTQTFSGDFIPKAKADQRESQADLVVIVTETFPKELGNKFGLKDGVYVCGFNDVKSLSIILRESIIKLSAVVATNSNPQTKVEQLYSYLTSQNFKFEIENIVSTFCEMQEDLNKEKRSISLMWSKRQESIESVLTGITRFIGTIKGISGNTIGQIKQLELPQNNEK